MKMIGSFTENGLFQGTIELGQFETEQLKTSKITWADKLVKKSFSIKVSTPTNVADLPGFDSGARVIVQRKLRSMPYNEARALNVISAEAFKERAKSVVMQVIDPVTAFKAGKITKAELMEYMKSMESMMNEMAEKTE
jgi:hypothetical protein